MGAILAAGVSDTHPLRKGKGEKASAKDATRKPKKGDLKRPRKRKEVIY